MKLTKISCFCKNNTPQIMIKGDINIVKCKNCGLVYADTEISDTEITQKYKINKDYFTEIRNSPIEIDDCKSRLRIIENILKHKGKILDFGTGDSRFLYIAREKGWDAYGVEINEHIAKIHVKNGIKILPEEKLKDDFFDAITMFHVLEHIPQPIGLLLKLNKKLKKNNILVVEVPNINALAVKLFKDKAAYIDTKGKGHLYYYSIKTLENILKKTGFVPIKRVYKGVSGLGQIMKAKEKITGSSAVENMYHYLKPLAICYKKFCEILGISDCIQVIAVKK